MSKKVTSFRLSEKALEELKKLATKENRSLANMVEELINREFKLKKKENKFLSRFKV